MPLWFEALPDGSFTSQSMGRKVLFEDRSATWKLKGGASVKMAFQNANPAPVKHGVDKLTARLDSFKGNDPKKWKTNMAAYQKVAYDALYPGVDLVFYGKGRKMEHDFVVAPHADPKQIRLAFEGASKLALDNEGNLNIDAGVERIELTKPVAYQSRPGGDRSEVAVRFAEQPDRSIGFEVGQYDASLPLVIDPKMLYSTYFGFSGEEEFVSVVSDPKTNTVWAVGSTDSGDFQGGAQLNGTNPSGGRDVMIAQFQDVGRGNLTIKYQTVYGGTGADEAAAIAIAPNGNVYVVGTTSSVDLPSVGAYSTTFQGSSDAFIMGLDPTQSGGNALVYSTFLGGTATDSATALTIDSKSILYVAGTTLSTDFPTSAGAILSGSRGGYDPWVAKIDPRATTSGLLYSTTYGGQSTDKATGVAVDAQGIIYLSGWTYSTDFPTSTPGPNYGYIGQGDLFLVGIDPSKSGNAGIVFASYFGGTGYDESTGMAFDPKTGYLYICGYTLSTDFPIVGNAPQRTNAGGADMFLMALDFKKQPDKWVVFSTYLGGTGDDVAFGMSIDPQGGVNLVGYTHPLSAIANPRAKAFPTTADAVQPTSKGLEEALIVRIDPSLPPEQSLTFSTFWGGSLNDVGLGVFADPGGCYLYAVGSTTSLDMYTVNYAYQPAPLLPKGVAPDAFLMSIDMCHNPGDDSRSNQ